MTSPNRRPGPFLAALAALIVAALTSSLWTVALMVRSPVAMSPSERFSEIAGIYAQMKILLMVFALPLAWFAHGRLVRSGRTSPRDYALAGLGSSAPAAAVLLIATNAGCGFVAACPPSVHLLQGGLILLSVLGGGVAGGLTFRALRGG